MSNSVNPVLTKVEDAFKEIIWDSFYKAALSALYASEPELLAWPAKDVIDYAARQFSDLMFKGVRLGVDLAAIPIINESHKRAWDTSCVRLKLLSRTMDLNSEEFRKAMDDASSDLAKFVHFNA